MLPLLTVKETLLFSAKFRLKEMTPKERELRVENLMHELGLFHIAHSFVGYEKIKVSLVVKEKGYQLVLI